MPSQNFDKRARKNGAAPRQEVILLDDGWDPTKYVAVGLRNSGCSVHIVTAAGEGECPDAKFLGRGITAEAVPLVRSKDYIGAVDAILANRPTASVLVLTEEILYRIWDADPAWVDRIFPNCQPWQRVLLRDKARMSEYVAKSGVQIPRQRLIPTEYDTAGTIEAMREFGFPVVVKGTTGSGGARVRIARTKKGVLDAIASLSGDGDCFLQEYVAGQEFSVGGLFLSGQPIRIHAWKRFKEVDVTGPSLRNRSDGDPALIDMALKMFGALQWTGLGFMQGVQRADSEDCFIEFNPRPWGSTVASARAGVDLFGPLACMLAGGTPEPDLSFIVGKQTTLFPQAAAARLREGGLRALLSLVREPHLWLDAPWSEPGLVAHFARQLWWRWRDGTKEQMVPALAALGTSVQVRKADDSSDSILVEASQK